MNHKDTTSLRSLRLSLPTLSQALSFRHAFHVPSSPPPSIEPSNSTTSPSILDYAETLLGHQDVILFISALSGETALAVNWFLVVVGEIEILEGELRADDVNAWKVKERNGKKGESGDSG
ncbi:hypothetical protein D9756_009862 [Leucocoprinus leucothites]|uniref:Uncharacterized protein n=1 Tax=Leucocoprinus leucothites TaxID=201217 RepID=A0A8H5FU59_9AGAR|nr:hypothetical protein D9756_009862 [Leucoagaricus leucothites]